MRKAGVRIGFLLLSKFKMIPPQRLVEMADRAILS